MGSDLPPGFTLDEPTKSDLPVGFTVDEPSDEPGFVDRAAGRIIERFSGPGKESFDALVSGEQGFTETSLQLAGNVGAGTALDVVGEGVVSVVGEENIKEIGRQAGKATENSILLKPLKGLVSRAVDEYKEYAEDNQRVARNLSAAGNLAILAAPVKVKPSTGIAARTSARIEAAANSQAATSRRSFIESLIKPKDTVRTRVDQASRTTETGPLSSKVTGLSGSERRYATAVESVEGVSGTRSYQGNYNKISDAVAAEADDLSRLVKDQKAVIPKEDIRAMTAAAQAELDAIPLMVGDAGKTGSKVISMAEGIIAKHPQTPAGMLTARKEFDATIRAQKGKKIFEGLENAQSTAVQVVRRGMNDVIAAKSPNVAVRESLSRQSSLLGAMENIATKAAHEGNNVAMRLWRRALALLPLRGELAQLGALALGVGGLGASAIMGPVITKGAVGTAGLYLTYRMVTGPGTKRALAKLLSATDKMIALETDKAVLRQLRADRAALLEIIKNSEESETNELREQNDR